MCVRAPGSATSAKIVYTDIFYAQKIRSIIIATCGNHLESNFAIKRSFFEGTKMINFSEGENLQKTEHCNTFLQYPCSFR